MNQKMDEMIKALRQLQVLLHAENSLTRDTLRACMEQGFADTTQRVQAVMNKVMMTYEAIVQVNQLILQNARGIQEFNCRWHDEAEHEFDFTACRISEGHEGLCSGGPGGHDAGSSRIR